MKTLLLYGLLTAFIMLTSIDASAQRPAAAPDLLNSSYVGVGYVANAPNAFLGGSVLGIAQRPRLGVYIDFKTTHASPEGEGFEPDLTPDDARGFGDHPLATREKFVSGNLAVVRPLSREIAAYVGAGLTQTTEYLEFEDQDQMRGRQGFYWVREPERPRDLNLLGGVFLHAGPHLLLQVGAETQPRGLTVGGVLALPLSR